MTQYDIHRSDSDLVSLLTCTINTNKYIVSMLLYDWFLREGIYSPLILSFFLSQIFNSISRSNSFWFPKSMNVIFFMLRHDALTSNQDLIMRHDPPKECVVTSLIMQHMAWVFGTKHARSAQPSHIIRMSRCHVYYFKHSHKFVDSWPGSPTCFGKDYYHGYLETPASWRYAACSGLVFLKIIIKIAFSQSLICRLWACHYQVPSSL